MLRQAAIASARGKAINVFFYAVTDPAIINPETGNWLGGLQIVRWADNTEIAYGVNTIINNLHSDAFVVKKIFNNPECSIIEKNTAGEFVNGYYIACDANTHDIVALVSRVPSEGSGFDPIVYWDSDAKEFMVQFEVQKYTGTTECAWDSSTGATKNSLANYAEDHYLPNSLTLAEYNIARALDAENIPYIVSPIKNDPVAESTNLASLHSTYGQLFASSSTLVTFPMSWLMGQPQGTFTAAANTFLNNIRF